jgi:hypothetical protein
VLEIGRPCRDLHGFAPGDHIEPVRRPNRALSAEHSAPVLAQRRNERRNDPRRRAAVDVALSLAELNAGWGDYDRALEHLAAADQLTGGILMPRFRPQREAWIETAATTAPV